MSIKVRKDGGCHCWFMVAAIFMSMLIMSISTLGVISILLYNWIEKFDVSLETATLAPSVMFGFVFLSGKC